MIDIGESTRECLLHSLECERCSAKTYCFVHVLEDERVFARYVPTASAPVAHIMTDHCLQLERNVLDDMRGVGSVAESHDETTALSNAAAMLDQSRHCFHERIGKSGHV